jgi:hypothetical protein
MENKDYLPKLNQLLSDIDFLEDFIKICAIDQEINMLAAKEMLRLIKDAKDRALK